MESHLLSKENQLSEVRTLLSEKEHALKQNEIASQEEQSRIQ